MAVWSARAVWVARCARGAILPQDPAQVWEVEQASAGAVRGGCPRVAGPACGGAWWSTSAWPVARRWPLWSAARDGDGTIARRRHRPGARTLPGPHLRVRPRLT